MSGVTKVKNHHCPQEGCKKSFVNEKDMMKHDAKHQVYEGHRNAFSFETCCFQCKRVDDLNRHCKTNTYIYPLSDKRPLRSAIASHYGDTGIILYPDELKTTNHFIQSHKTILR